MNRRITVLQTAALPLGYAAVNRKRAMPLARELFYNSRLGTSLPATPFSYGAGHALTRGLFYHGAGGNAPQQIFSYGAGNGI